MGGKFSRSKGRREEAQLVLYLVNRGYTAKRNITQYQTAGQHDVDAEKDGKKYTFEKKSRRNSFKSIYALYYAERDSDGLMCFTLSSSGTAVAMSTDFEQVLNCSRVFRNLSLFPPGPKELKVFERIVRLDELRQTADYLVIKDNGKPNIFLRFWG